MNIFTQHTRAQGVTYIEHCLFALRIAARLLNTVIAFAVHAIFPFIDIRQDLDLEATTAFLDAQNNWIESKKHAEVDNFRDLDYSPLRITR